MKLAVLITIFLFLVEIENSQSSDVWFCKYDTQMLKQSDAGQLCVSMGGKLAKVYNSQEDAAIRSLNLTTSYWFDLKMNLSSHTFSFSDGTAPSNDSKLWTPKQPDWSGECGQYWKAGGSLWDDSQCTNLKGTLCEFKSQQSGCSHVTRAEAPTPAPVIEEIFNLCIIPQTMPSSNNDLIRTCKYYNGSLVRFYTKNDFTKLKLEDPFSGSFTALNYDNGTGQWVYSDGSKPKENVLAPPFASEDLTKMLCSALVKTPKPMVFEMRAVPCGLKFDNALCQLKQSCPNGSTKPLLW